MKIMIYWFLIDVSMEDLKRKIIIGIYVDEYKKRSKVESILKIVFLG